MSDTPSPHDTYTSPLAARNASPEMLRLWSPRHKFNTWRRIWLAVAEAQHEVTKDRDGGPFVTKSQVEALRTVVERGITDAELARAAELERDLRHDVMAHVHCLGESCPEAKAIIHLGCTSQDVVCNADLLTVFEACRLSCAKLAAVVLEVAQRAGDNVGMPTLGFTHYQAAQPTTVGRRLAGYAYELSLVLERLDDLRETTDRMAADRREREQQRRADRELRLARANTQSTMVPG
ncbi:MAG: lyase family protein, partial [Planctomycetota bacterium]